MKGKPLVVTLLATTAASWAALMALAPLLQIRRMWLRQSSDDVSVGYLLILLPGFLLWAGYGVAISDPYLVAPNVLAFAVGCATVGYALRLRIRPRQPAAAGALTGRGESAKP